MKKVRIDGGVHAALLIISLIYQLLLIGPVHGQFMCVDYSENTEVQITKEEALSCLRCPCLQVYIDCVVGPDSYGFLIEERLTMSDAFLCDQDSTCACKTSDDYDKRLEEKIGEAKEKAASFEGHPNFTAIRNRLKATLPEGSSIINVQQTFWCLETETQLRSVVEPTASSEASDVKCTRDKQTKLDSKDSFDYQLRCQGVN